MPTGGVPVQEPYPDEEIGPYNNTVKNWSAFTSEYEQQQTRLTTAVTVAVDNVYGCSSFAFMAPVIYIWPCNLGWYQVQVVPLPLPPHLGICTPRAGEELPHEAKR